MQKRLLVLGATGGTGLQVVEQALALGHDVTALVRSPERLAAKSERLRVLTGSVTDPALLGDAVRGRDAVISALGAGNSFKSNGLIARCASAIVTAMEREGVRRLVFTSAFGVGSTMQDLPFLPRLFIWTLLRDLYADKAAGEEILRKSGIDWTVVYPSALNSGPRTGRYRVGEHLALRGFPSLSRADLAEFLLVQAGDETFVRKGVMISL